MKIHHVGYVIIPFIPSFVYHSIVSHAVDPVFLSYSPSSIHSSCLQNSACSSARMLQYNSRGSFENCIQNGSQNCERKTLLGGTAIDGTIIFKRVIKKCCMRMLTELMLVAVMSSESCFCENGN
jgi:hypothetical protein